MAKTEAEIQRDEQYKQEVAKFIQTAREHLGMDRNEFAAMLDYTRRSIAYWEAAEKAPPQAVLKLVANELAHEGHYIAPPSR